VDGGYFTTISQYISGGFSQLCLIKFQSFPNKKKKLTLFSRQDLGGEKRVGLL